MATEKKIIRDTDAESIRLAKTLIRTARFGALATLDPDDGSPLATRVGVATAMDGTPTILVSSLSAHTQALMKDARCSLLLGEPGKGDPLVHPRVTLVCSARQLGSGVEEQEHVRRRYLMRHPKAQLYAGFVDFSFYRLDIVRANLNGGFGRAYKLTAEELLCTGPIADLTTIEADLIRDANIGVYGHIDALRSHGSVAGIDPEGIDLMGKERLQRLLFPEPLSTASQFAAAFAALPFKILP